MDLSPTPTPYPSTVPASSLPLPSPLPSPTPVVEVEKTRRSADCGKADRGKADGRVLSGLGVSPFFERLDATQKTNSQSATFLSNPLVGTHLDARYLWPDHSMETSARVGWSMSSFQDIPGKTFGRDSHWSLGRGAESTVLESGYPAFMRKFRSACSRIFSTSRRPLQTELQLGQLAYGFGRIDLCDLGPSRRRAGPASKRAL